MINLYSHQFHAMGSPCQIQLYAESELIATSVFAAMVEEIERLEAKYSRYREESLLSRINNAAGEQSIEIDEETLAICQYAQAAYQLSDGFFDVTTGVLSKVWDFKSATEPKPELLNEILPLIGWHRVELTPNRLFLPDAGMKIDFGGIVKEYAADAAKSVAIANDIKAGLVELGGDISVIGPHPGGEAWRIGIKTGESQHDANVFLPATKGAVASSGDYERVLWLNGKKYSHILNPKTGWPCAGVTAVSVWAEQCVVAGTVATIAMLLESSRGIQWLEESELPFVAKTREGKIIAHQA